MKKIAEVEILRAVAISLTLFQHLGLLLFPARWMWSWVNYNAPFWGGVDLFFCISGFVICRGAFSADWSSGIFWKQAGAFWIRRVFRIVPTLWLWLGIFLFCAWRFNDAGGFGLLHADLGDAQAAVLNYANIHIFACVRGQAACGPNPVFWSLSLEEQFYLCLPLALLLPRRILALLVLVLIVVQLPIARLPWRPTVGGALWFARTDALLLGAGVAAISRRPAYEALAQALQRCRPFRVPVTTALIAGLMAFPRSGVSFCAGGIAVTSCGLVLLASFDRGFLFGHGRIARVFEWVGSRSYSLYLIHMPVYWAINEALFRLSPRPETYRAPLINAPFHPTLAILTFIGIFVVSDLNYRWVETPFRRLGRSIAEGGHGGTVGAKAFAGATAGQVSDSLDARPASPMRAPAPDPLGTAATSP